MYQDTDKIAQDIFDRSLAAVEVNPSDFRKMFAVADPGWAPFDEPENYRWFLVRNFPVKKLDVTLEKLMSASGYPGHEKFRHDRIVELLKKGAVEWPVFVSATGIIADGYHRIAAHLTMKRKTVDVIVSVALKPEDRSGMWDEAWLEAFPR